MDTLPNGFSNNLDSRLTRYLCTIRGNCGDPQPPMAHRTAINTIFIGYQNFDKAVASNIHDDALEKGLIVEWVDGDGCSRVGLTQDGFESIPDTVIYGPEDIDPLREIAGVEIDRHEPDQEIIGWANGWVEWIKDNCQTEIDES